MDYISSWIHSVVRLKRSIVQPKNVVYEVKEGSLVGKLAIVTGGTKGIGKHIALQLARGGAEVIIAGRTLTDDDLRRNKNITFIPLDLSDLRSVREFSRIVHDKYGSRGLDLLINNAGIGGVPCALSPQGHEMHFATNVLGHYLLTRLLLDMLERVKSITKGRQLARVVVLTGDIYVLASDCTSNYTYSNSKLGILWGGGSGLLAYCRSKLGNLWFGFELARRYSSTLVVSVVHPGVIQSGLFQQKENAGNSHAITCDQGAIAPLKCAVDDNIVNGAYYHNSYDGPVSLPPYDHAVNKARAQQFWDQCEGLAAGFL